MDNTAIRLIDAPWTTPDEGCFDIYNGEQPIGRLLTGGRTKEWTLMNLHGDVVAVFYGDRERITPLAIATVEAALWPEVL